MRVILSVRHSGYRDRQLPFTNTLETCLQTTDQGQMLSLPGSIVPESNAREEQAGAASILS